MVAQNFCGIRPVEFCFGLLRTRHFWGQAKQSLAFDIGSQANRPHRLQEVLGKRRLSRTREPTHDDEGWRGGVSQGVSNGEISMIFFGKGSRRVIRSLVLVQANEGDLGTD